MKIRGKCSFGNSKREFTYKKTSHQKQIEEQKKLIAIKEITEFYKPGWQSLSQRERQSISAIATALLRKGIITQYKSEKLVLLLLKMLAKAGRISLPPKTNRGGARKMKK